MSNTSHLRYRPEIDGLRALSVLAVVLYHTGFGCPGGFIGVDVFFVISGFLITSLIWKDLESGKFTFADFWERRARRIIPALVAVTLVTLVAGWFILLPADFESLGKAAASQSIFAANFHYWNELSYFALAAEERSLLHTWSLSVEEQFYLIAPFLFWLAFRSRMFRQRKTVSACVAAAGLISLGLSIYALSRHPSFVFYLLPTRAWELLLGALTALVPIFGTAPPSRWKRELITIAGLALILVPIFAYDTNTPFPGLAALPPCLGAAMIIGASGPDRSSITASVLSLRPLTFIGAVSYSWYLWHWPILAFHKYQQFATPSLATQITLLVTGFICAVLSWRFVETPFRKRTVGTSRKTMFAFASSGLIAVFAAGAMVVSNKGCPSRIPADAARFAAASGDVIYYENIGISQVKAGKLHRLGTDAPGQSPSLLLWGDSHAKSAAPAVDALLKARGLTGEAATFASSAPLVNWYKVNQFGLNETNIAWSEAVIAHIDERKIPAVILAGYWSAKKKPGGMAEKFDDAMLETVRRLVSIGTKPYVMLDAPVHSFDVPRALARLAVTGDEVGPFCARPSTETRYDGIAPEIILAIEKAGGIIINPKPAFLDPTGQFYMVLSQGNVLYRDSHHLSITGAIEILQGVLASAIHPGPENENTGQ